MFWKNIKISFRNILRNKVSGIIGILGFSIGFTACLFIGTYLFSEYSTDKAYKDYKRMYRLVDTEKNVSGIDYGLYDALSENFVEVEKNCPLEIQPNIDAVVYSGNDSYYVKGLISTNNSFFEFFSVKVIEALDLQNPFVDKQSSVITASTALKIFGEENPLGKPLSVFNMKTIVSAVIEDFEPTSSICGKILLNSDNKHRRLNMTVGNGIMYNTTNHYILLAESASDTLCESIINRSLASFTQFAKTVSLQPVKDIYLDNQIRDNNRHGSKKLLLVLAAIGIFILLLSVVNYINYIFSFQLRRLKEVGIKKTNGAGIVNLLGSFFTDIIIWIFLAFLISLAIIVVVLPLVNQLFEIQLSFASFLSFPVLIGISIILLVVLVVSLIPMFVLLSKFNLHNFLSNKLSSSGQRKSLNPLSIFQLTVSIFLLVGIITIHSQIKYVKNKDLGFDVEALLYVDIPYKALNYKDFKEELLKHTSIKKATLSSGVPGKLSSQETHPEWDFTAYEMGIDTNFLSVMNIKLIAGEMPSPNNKKAYLVNEAALKAFEINDFRKEKVNGKDVVGVVEDFNFKSLHTEIEPLFLDMDEGRSLSLKISGTNIAETLKYIQSVWEDMAGNAPFKYEFYDSWFDSMYKKEEQQAKAISIFSIIALVITCLGLLGQVYQTTQQRTKEIGIRKVNGAKVTEILAMLNRDFIKWVVIAFVVACPIAYYAMNKWLENFAYKTTLSWWIFALAGVLALGIALLTVSWQSWRAATRNPVEALRYE